MNGEQTFNFNNTCIHQVSHWGNEVIYNICTGATVTIEWGFMYYLTALIVILTAMAFPLALFWAHIRMSKS